MSRPALRVGLVGCGLIGDKRAASLGGDVLVGCCDLDARAAAALAARHGTDAVETFAALLELDPDVVLVAVSHDALADFSERALRSGAHVLVEKPAGIGTEQVDRIRRAQLDTGRLVKVGFNHRFHPGIARAAAEVHSAEHGPLLHVRGRYGHGGRPGYDREWRAEPDRSGGGELIDQGMHLLDLVHWIAGPLPLHSALLRTQFWDMPVEDNAALLLGATRPRDAPWAMLHVSWTEWKNMFSLEIYCARAKLAVHGLTRSYGPQQLTIYRMKPELGPPDVEEIRYPDGDPSWEAEWNHFADAIVAGDGRQLLGDLNDAHFAWEQVQAAYAATDFPAAGAGVRT